MRYKSIAVTGGNGDLGHAIVQDLVSDANVTALDISAGKPGVQSSYTDVLSKESLRESLVGHDAIVHVAALLLPTDSQEKMFHVNVIGTWNVLQVAEELGIRKVVLISSECSSGIINIQGSPQPCPDYLPVDEEHPLRPLETYGMSKKINEVTARSFARREEMQIVALRPTWILMPGMEKTVREVRETDDHGLWSYVELRDVVQAARLALEYDGPAFDSFYLSARDTFSPEETLTFMERKFGNQMEIRNTELYKENPFAAIWDLSRTESLLGLKPESDWRRFISGADSEYSPHA